MSGGRNDSLFGDAKNITGNVQYLAGNITNFSGNASGIEGRLNIIELISNDFDVIKNLFNVIYQFNNHIGIYPASEDFTSIVMTEQVIKNLAILNKKRAVYIHNLSKDPNINYNRIRELIAGRMFINGVININLDEKCIIKIMA